MRGLACVAGMGTRRYIMDIGSGNELVNALDFTAEERKSHRHTGMAQALHTANGIIETDEEVTLSIPKLGLTENIPLPDTPSVLSIGRRCTKLNYDFIWQRVRRPYMVTSDYRKIFLEVDRDVPILGCIPVTPALPDIGVSLSEAQCAEADAAMFGDKPAPLGYANLDDVEADRKRLSAKKGAGNGAQSLEPLLLIGDIPANHWLTHKPKPPKCIVCNACKTIPKRLIRSIDAQKDEWEKIVKKLVIWWHAIT